MYSLIAYVAQLLLPVAALFSKKMSLFVKGRRGQFARMEAAISPDDRVVWIHASSMGEFEEVRPIVERIRNEHPEFKTVVTFFSPSGYEAYKNWKGADCVFYLPVDTPYNASRFIRIVHPEIAIFSITDYWFNHLKAMKRYGTRAYVVSALFTEGMTVFKWYGFAYRRIIRNAFANILTKDDRSVELLETIGFDRGVRCGDPRFDRVINIAESQWHDPVMERFCSDFPVFIAGSTVTREDDEIAVRLANLYPDVRFVFVPHEIEENTMSYIETAVQGEVLRHSACGEDTDFTGTRALIVDCVGKLARIYRYGRWALVGGGFYKGLHSVIEASVYGLPVITGPVFNNRPAEELVRLGIDGVANAPEDAVAWFDRLYRDKALYEETGKRAHEYCYSNKGASDAIMKIIFG